MARSRIAVGVVVLLRVAGPRMSAAPASLEAALELYAAAAYEEALAAFDAVSGTGLTTDDHVVVAQHRMLCLMAMGRTSAAERAAADLLALRPDFVLGAHDAAPRVRTMFDATRRRVLPGVVRELFSAARRLYAAGEIAEARTAFATITQALGDETVVGEDATLADLRTLADGFLALSAAAPRPTAPPVKAAASVAAAAPEATTPPTLVVDESASLVSFPTDPAVSWRQAEGPHTAAPTDAGTADTRPAESTATNATLVAETQAPAPAPAPSPEPTPARKPEPTPEPTPAPLHEPAPVSRVADDPVVVSAAPARVRTSTAMPAPEPLTRPAAPVAGAPFTPIDIFTYDWRDKDVAPPVPVTQAVSGWWGGMGEPPAGTLLGAVEVVVDERGAVEEARIYQSVNRVYDGVLMASVKQWRYTPATRGGRAVKYRRITGVVSGR